MTADPRGILSGARVLVTGASGFIGRHAVTALLECDADVFALDRVPGGVVGSERSLVADISDSRALASAVASAEPAFVLHLAGRKDRTSALDDFGPMLAANAVSTSVLVAECAKSGGLRSFVTLGTAEEYGHQPCPFRESMCEEPASAYSLSKMAVSHVLRAAHRLHGIPATELRATLAYGPGQPPDLFLPALIGSLAEGRRFEMSPGEQTRDFVFISDLVAAILAALVTPEAAGRVLNVGAGEPVTLAGLARHVERLMGREGLVAYGAVPYRTGEVMDYWVDTSLAREILGWEPRVDLETGLRITIDDVLGR